MTERERWIVYPLLFLALGVALRDKLSEHTKTRRIECQELIIYSGETAGQPAVPLIELGSLERTSAQSPHIGKIAVNGLIQARGIEAESMQAANVNADRYFFQRIPFAPLMRAIPGVSAADQLRAQQLQQQQAAAAKAAQERAAEQQQAKEQPSAEITTPPDAANPAQATNPAPPPADADAAPAEE